MGLLQTPRWLACFVNKQTNEKINIEPRKVVYHRDGSITVTMCFPEFEKENPIRL